jgi:hypothetical protein
MPKFDLNPAPPPPSPWGEVLATALMMPIDILYDDAVF